MFKSKYARALVVGLGLTFITTGAAFGDPGDQPVSNSVSALVKMVDYGDGPVMAVPPAVAPDEQYRSEYPLREPVAPGAEPAVDADLISAPAVKVLVDGQPLDFADGNPYLDRETSRVYVPLRYVSEALGAVVDWKPETRTAVVELKGHSIEMAVDEAVPLVNGSPGAELDAPARLKDGRVMVPLRFVSETLGYAVDWAGEEGTVWIETPAEAEDESKISITAQLVQSVTDEIEVNMRIPVISGLPDRALEEKINAEFAQKAEDFRKEIEEPFAEYKESMEKYGGPVHAFQAVTDYDEHYNQDGLLSISVSYYGFQGGAHGFTVKETLNLDVETGERLTIADFFGPEEDYKSIVVRTIQEAIAANPDMYFEDALDTVAQITDGQQFYIKDDGHIVVYFGQYEIGPYAIGMPEFDIPVSMMP